MTKAFYFDFVFKQQQQQKKKRITPPFFALPYFNIVYPNKKG